MDFLSEICAKKSTEYLTGTYYKRLPVTSTDKGEPFSYEIVDARSREYRTILGNLVVEGRVAAIKTRAALDFAEKEYICTQDGQFWQITAMLENVQVDGSKQALRFFKDTALTEKVIRLIGKENPKNLK